MHRYFVNTQAQPTGEHEVHRDGCPNPPEHQHRQSLGYHPNCVSAVNAARRYFREVDGCAKCAPECHGR
ncbi:MAG: hypothetical protein ACF8PN_09885 [Phycisphaerales bacterium]